jgi:hypothetical protein
VPATGGECVRSSGDGGERVKGRAPIRRAGTGPPRCISDHGVGAHRQQRRSNLSRRPRGEDRADGDSGGGAVVEGGAEVGAVPVGEAVGRGAQAEGGGSEGQEARRQQTGR